MSCGGYWSGCEGEYSGGWYDYGRWVLLAIIIALALIVAWGVRLFSINRVRHGRSPPTGTGWMVPPSYYQSQRQYGNPINAAPPYNPEMGDQDAGYYDASGNFVAKPPVAYQSENPYEGDSSTDSSEHGLPSEHQARAQSRPDYSGNGIDPSQVGPPEGPPPGHTLANNDPFPSGSPRSPENSAETHAMPSGTSTSGETATRSAYYPPPRAALKQ